MVPTLEKIESGKVWSPSTLVSPTAITSTTTPTALMRSAEQERIRDSLRLDDLKTISPKVMNEAFARQYSGVNDKFVFFLETSSSFKEKNRIFPNQKS